MAITRCIPAVLLAVLACAAQAQTSLYAPSRPSTPSTASGPTVEFDDAGNPRPGTGAGAGASATGATAAPGAGAAGARAGTHAPATHMLGAGAFNQSSGLESAVNSGTPPSWDRRAGVRKVCPPGMENRNNVCSAPLGSIISP